MSKKLDPCKLTESLLLKKMVEGLNEQESALAKDHLEECASCRHFAVGLLDIKETFSSNNENKVKPRAETLIHLKDKVKGADNTKGRKVGTWKFTAKSHVYPALAAAIIAIMVIFSINTVRPVSEVTPIDTTYIQIMKLTQPAVVDLSSFNQQAGGKSIREDSLLLNYIYSGM